MADKVIKAKDPILRLSDQELLFQKRPGLTSRSKAIVMVDVAKVDASLAKNPAAYVGPGGEGEIAGRVAGAHEFFEKARAEKIPVHLSDFYFRPGTKELAISDGRHRFAALRERGATVIPVSVDKEDAEEVARLFGADPKDRVRDVTGEARKAAREKTKRENALAREAVLAERKERERVLKAAAEKGLPAKIEVKKAPISIAPPKKAATAPKSPTATSSRRTSGSRKRPAVPELAERVFRAHLTQLHRHVEMNGVHGLKRMYADARGELVDRLRGVGKLSESVEARSIRAMLAQVDAVSARLGRRLKDHLRDVGKTAVEMGAKHGTDEFRVLEEHFSGTTPVLNVEKPAVFRGLVKDVDSSLLRRHSLQAGTWTSGAVLNMEKRLSVSAMTGKHLEHVVDDLVSELDTERWKAERIVRTEMSYAHGAAKQRSLQETAADFDRPLMKRLIETFDDRTGDDSFLLHGQTVPVDKPFTWKKKKAGGWVLVEFMHPPNRPNDRAVVIPWNPEWDADADDSEKPLTMGELSGAPPTRWRSRTGVAIPPGHRPGKAYGREDYVDPRPLEEPPPPPPPEDEEVELPPPPPPKHSVKKPPPKQVPVGALDQRLQGETRLKGERRYAAKPKAMKKVEKFFGKPVTPEELARLSGMPPGGGHVEVTTSPVSSSWRKDEDVKVSVRYVRPPETFSVGGQKFEVEWYDNEKVRVTSKSGAVARIAYADKGLRVDEGEVSKELLDLLTSEVTSGKVVSYKSFRTVAKAQDGSTYIKNDFLEVFPSGSGVGTEIFARQIREAERLGVSKIKTEAVRTPALNGYYTWARLGYDGPVPYELKEKFPGVERVSEIVSTPEGLARWKEVGDSFSGDFDVKKGSYSRNVLERYLGAKAKKEGGGGGSR